MCPECSSEPSLGRGMALRLAVTALLALLNLNLVTADHFRSLLSPLSSLSSLLCKNDDGVVTGGTAQTPFLPT